MKSPSYLAGFGVLRNQIVFEVSVSQLNIIYLTNKNIVVKKPLGYYLKRNITK